MAFWRWLSFSQGGICDRSLEGMFFLTVPLYRGFPQISTVEQMKIESLGQDRQWKPVRLPAWKSLFSQKNEVGHHDFPSEIEMSLSLGG